MIESYTQTSTSTSTRLNFRSRKNWPPYLVSRNVSDHVVRTVQRVGQGVLVCCLVQLLKYSCRTNDSGT